MLTIVIIGLTVGALLSALGTVGRAANSQRISVRTDSVLRGYAEAIKFGAQSCVVSGTFSVSYSPPAGFVPSGVTATGNACPPVATPKFLQLKVVGPLGVEERMDIKVITP